MIISVVSPHSSRTGNTVSSILLALGLADTKRKVLLTHIKPQSFSFDQYLGLKDFEDKTTTPTQLVKLMREGAIKTEDIGDYCKLFEEYLYVFTNKETNFSEHDIHTLIETLLRGEMPFDYLVFDIDEKTEHETTELVLSKSNIIILNVTDSFSDLSDFNRQRERIAKMCKGKKVILLCSMYDPRVVKLKEITGILKLDTNCYTIRRNVWLKWGCNKGKIVDVFKQAKLKNPELLEAYRDANSLAMAVSKAKIAIGKAAKGVFK